MPAYVPILVLRKGDGNELTNDQVTWLPRW